MKTPELVGAPIRRDGTNQQNNKQNISIKQTPPNRSGTPNKPGMPNRPGLRNKPSDQGRPGSFNRQSNTSRPGPPIELVYLIGLDLNSMVKRHLELESQYPLMNYYNFKKQTNLIVTKKL